MRILLIDVNCKNSSTGNIVYNLYNYINISGDEAAICYGRGPLIKEKKIFKFGLDLETYFHAVMTRITGFTGCFSFISTYRLIKYIKNFKPDIVHIHELHAYFVNIETLIKFLKKNKIKTIMTLHCEFIYTGKCGHSVECEQWKTECKKCPHLHDYISTKWFDKTNYMFNKKKELFKNFKELLIITPSKWLGNRVKESFLKKYPLKIICNGIDTDIFCPKNTKILKERLRIKDDEKVVLSLAPHIMSKEKGGVFIKEIANLIKDKKIKFILIGVDGVRKEYKDNLILFGPIYDKKLLAEYYSLADLFLICSERENFPTTCIEAQCCGTPIYGFDTGGVKETLIKIKSKDENRLVKYKDLKSLVKLIEAAPKKVEEDTKILSNKAIEKYSIERFCELHKIIYKGLK
ncbi:glycosyltransferase [uncultured Fusobacterium sp.]|uniref:glycosyltransferase n=1 Tax=uncultured Fusobacterium sp. TaxID=159267 RepID=UPI0025906CA6|nr:glycosyltransferase [uncultured Fusobacterium sp.]